MRTTTAFNECAEALKTQVRFYWANKQSRLEELLSEDVSEDHQLDLTVHHQPQSSRYEVRAVLQLPKATLTAEACDSDVAAALDRVTDLLMQATQNREERALLSPSEAMDCVDETSTDSFPASDAPSWTPVTSAGPPSSIR
ncbi:MAG TPA: HPF/RaiA family ribosome-associated protein [Gemmataceae bacterium]|nr:HPF/RaiA family ribosome-associated protein [Gemmataceae bacterium]